MIHRAYFELAASVISNVASYVVYRSIAGVVPRIWWPMFTLGLILGAANTFLFARSLETVQLSVAYPVFSGACFALITFAAAMIFGERLQPTQLLGVGIVVIGIVLVTK